MNKNYITIQEVMKLLNCGKTKAYSLKESKTVKNILGRNIKYNTEDGLRYLKEDIEQIINSRKRTTTVISLMNHKGGVAKTTSVANMGVVLAKKGYKTLLIDLDYQANLTSTFRKDSDDKNIDFSQANMFHLFEKIKTFEQVNYKTRVGNLFILPSNIRVAELTLSEKGEFFLSKQIENMTDFDYILIDTPPSISENTKIALMTSDYVLIPMEFESYSMDGLLGMLKSINIVRDKNKNLEILGIFGTKVRKRTNVVEAIRKALANHEKLLNTEISEREDVRQATLMSSTVVEYFPKSIVSKEYKELVEETLNV